MPVTTLPLCLRRGGARPRAAHRGRPLLPQDIGIEARRWSSSTRWTALADGAGDAMARRHDGIAVSALHRTGLRRLLARAEGMPWAHGTGVPNLPAPRGRGRAGQPHLKGALSGTTYDRIRYTEPMAMGKRPAAGQGFPLWVTTADLPTNAGHPFFERLNRVLEEAGFDAFVAGLCAVFYAARMGRPSLLPGPYFRMLLIGYFEGPSSKRGIAWRVADSLNLNLRSFLDLDVAETSPDHSTLSRKRPLIDVETQEAVFTRVLERLAEAGQVKAQTVGIDATTLEANAAMRSIERQDTGEPHKAFIRRLAAAFGVETQTRADLARFDRSRKNKPTSNKDCKSPQDPDARIAKMRDGRTHLAHKAEHGVDMDTGAIVTVTGAGCIGPRYGNAAGDAGHGG